MRRALVLLVDLILVALVAWKLRPIVEAMSVRIQYPGDIEWMEGATLVSALRVHDGLSIYGQPALDYIPFIYPPLYAAAVGALGHLFTLGYPLARTLSALCALGAAVNAVIAARQEGASWGTGVLCAGLFWLCWDEGGTFYDLVRTDSISLFLLSSAIVLGRAKSPIPAGVILAVAFAAKQHAAIFGLPMLIWRYRHHGKEDAKRFALASAGTALAFTAVMTAATRGGFWTWLVSVPALHGVRPERLFPQAQVELWEALPWACSAGLLLPLWMKRNGYWLGISLAGLFVTTMMRAHVGGFVNVLIPGFWIVAVWPAVMAGSLRLPFARWAGTAVALVQLWKEPVEVERYVPTEKDRKAVEELVELIRDLDGPVLLPHAPWYAVLAGKEPTFALICLWDADRRYGPMRHAVDVVSDAMAERHWAYAIVPDDKLGYGFKSHYQRDRTVRVPVASTRVGWRVRFGQLWVAKAEAD